MAGDEHEPPASYELSTQDQAADLSGEREIALLRALARRLVAEWADAERRAALSVYHSWSPPEWIPQWARPDSEPAPGLPAHAFQRLQLSVAVGDALLEAQDWAQHLSRDQSAYGRTAAREFGGTHGRPVPAWLDDEYLREWDADWMRGQVPRDYRRPPSHDDDPTEPGGTA